MLILEKNCSGYSEFCTVTFLPSRNGQSILFEFQSIGGLCHNETIVGQLARVGVTESPRNAWLFGWVRNLKATFIKAFNLNDHEQNISSLCSLFYALLRSQLPWLGIKYKQAMSPAQLPRLD
jgi:hypothetical protein